MRSTSIYSQSRKSLVQELGIPYRVVNVAAGDLGASAAKKYDIEAWFPASSATARSRRRRTRPTTRRGASTSASAAREARAPAHAERHCCDGAALIAIVENFQNDDGTVAVPEPLVELGAPQRLGGEKVTA